MEIITHVKPHLDEVCCVWLIRRFWPGAQDATVSYVMNSHTEPGIDADPARLFVGVGRGRFDEHRGADGECAASLVWSELAATVEIDAVSRTAVERLIEWVRTEDLGNNRGLAGQEFTIPNILEGAYLASGSSSEAIMELGQPIMAALFEMERQRAVMLKDWEARREFTSRFGRAVAVTSNAVGMGDHAYEQGFDLVLLMNREGTYRAFRARAAAPIDLSPVAAALKTADPGASWFLHHAKHLLLLGGPHQPDATPSRLTLDDMIALVK